MSDITVRELQHFVFGIGSVVFNWNLQEQNASIESLWQFKKQLLMQKNTSKNDVAQIRLC